MLRATCHVGRLVELRLSGSPTIADAEQFERDAHAAIAQCVRDTKKMVVICSDLRETHVFSPEVTERLIHTMRGANPNLERHAMLGNGSALFSLQMARLIREAAADTRRKLFTSMEPLVAWMDELMTAAERSRMRQFFTEVGAGPVVPETTEPAKTRTDGSRPGETRPRGTTSRSRIR